MQDKILMCWSGGKDSSMALYELIKNPKYEIAALLTTVTEGYDRISMHGVRRELLEQQAESLGFPLKKIYITQQADNEEYANKMENALKEFQQQSVNTAAFGDLFLEDLKQYREQNLKKVGMDALFPIWMRDTNQCVRDFIGLGFKAVVTCVDTRVLDASFSGRIIDEQFLEDLPAHVDPCGENGEFHSFVFAGPIFKHEISITVGEVVIRDGYAFCDLLPN